MMYPRLRLLKACLTEDGSIFVSMDDSESGSLRILLDDVFGRGIFLASIVWQKVLSPKNSAQFIFDDQQCIYAYTKKIRLFQLDLLARSAEQDARYTNSNNDTREPWTSGDLSARNFYSEGTYPVEAPSGRIIPGPPTGMYWRVSKTKMKELGSGPINLRLGVDQSPVLGGPDDGPVSAERDRWLASYLVFPWRMACRVSTTGG